jgi:spermidine synthase
MRRRTATTAVLLFLSGACALTYQTVWLRQFRMIFGGSTFATAAVLAIFMGGLGAGSALLGRRADAHPKPLVFYGQLELLIAAFSAVSIALLWLVAKLYFAAGGSVTLGLFGASVVRLLLAAVVLAIPTVLMGGTLPAAARAVESNDDDGRRRLSLLYGANTLGAVTGTLLSTFWALELFGNRKTLLIAVLVNVLVGVFARSMGSGSEVAELRSSDEVPLNVASAEPRNRSRYATLVAAAIVGFAFLLMELVWYRMLAPLLGGSTFTFGLILAVALLGIGLGGAAYSFWSGRTRATVGGFALTCALEAAFIALPFALGDRLAIAEYFLRSLGQTGFPGYVFAWTILTLIVVLPAAFVSGVQFPLLISILGRGRNDVGRDVGSAYAWNTAGAIVGSLAGGFGLVPLLSAPGVWRLVIVLLALLGIAAALLAMREKDAFRAVAAVIFAIAAIGGTFALGPTAVWRHAGIGAGRATISTGPNQLRNFVNNTRGALAWDVDGRESGVALLAAEDYAFVVNGKVDGSARGDDGTQVMAGLVGAILHPKPQRSLVIGLGTGSTAGWLGAVPTMQRVDVVELEPAILRVARACTTVNHDVLHNPKVKIRIADAREVLLTTADHYDIIFSEPSNPYRAGIASLFTDEFYRASKSRLNTGGIFLQWLQAYDVDAGTIRTIYTTIARVFPSVETWHTAQGDLLLVATEKPIAIDMASLRQRVASEPFASALTNAWHTESAEGFLSHYVASDGITRAITKDETEWNSDDRTLVEFTFARGVGEGRFDIDQLTALARARGADVPHNVRRPVDWSAVSNERAAVTYVDQLPAKKSPELQARRRAHTSWDSGSLHDVFVAHTTTPFDPVNSSDLAMLAEAYADEGEDRALPYIEALRATHPIDADAVTARLLYRQAKPEEATAALVRALGAYHSNPWPTVDLMHRAFDLIPLLSRQQRNALPLLAQLERPFAASQWDETRRMRRVFVARQSLGCSARTLAALHALEPWPPWHKGFLQLRLDCYRTSMSRRAADAERDYMDFLVNEPERLVR